MTMQTGAAAGSLFGRDRELEWVHGFLERVATGPAPAALVLEGEPGIGKTTLWRAGLEAARAYGCRVLEARPVEAERELSFSALGDLLGPALDRLDALSPPRRRALEVALLLASDGVAPDARAIGLATLDLMRLAAAEQPLLLAIDDMQWLDAPSQETLAYALRRLDAEHVALVGARRPGADELILGRTELVVVGPLSVGALHELLGERLGARLTRPTLVRVHETSGGNPFFALELARALEGREVRPGEPLPVPASLGELTASHFERLDAEAREVLLCVAALARPTVEVVTAAAGDPATRALEAAVAAGLLEMDRSRLRFTHPLLASVHYGSASPNERARVHRRLAEVVTDAEERGRHLGAAATVPEAEIAAALDEAAAAGRARGAPAAAAELAEVSVRLTAETDSSSVLRRQCAAADHHLAAGSTRRARVLLEQALGGAPRGADRARIALQLAEVVGSQDVVAERTLLARALREAELDTALRAEIHHAFAYHFVTDIRESRRHARLALHLAERAGDPGLIAETLAHAFDRDFWAGAGIDHALIGRGLALEEQLPRLALPFRPSCSYAFALKWSGDLEQAAPLWERLRARGRAEGDLEVMTILFFSTYHELIAEDWEQAARFADEALALGVDAERDAETATYLWSRAVIAAYRGDVDRARYKASEAHRLAADVGLSDLLFGPRARCAGPVARRTRFGARAPAARDRREAVDGGAGAWPLARFPGARRGGGRLRRAGRSGRIAGLRRGARAAAGSRLGARLLRARAGAARSSAGRPGGGRGGVRVRLRAARAPAAAAAHVRAGAHAARARLDPAAAAAEAAGARGARAGAHDLRAPRRARLRGAGTVRARAHRRPRGGRAAAAGDDLSETERQIADLVAQGRSNREVAAALSLSPKTVEWNLSKVYAKLGVRSRTELASRRR
jgi:DNA-binding CsgD family transcriptional regulator